MKICFFFWLGFAAAICLGQPTPSQSPSPTQAQEELLTTTTQRVRSGDYKALFEAAKLPPEIAIPYISYWGTDRVGPRAPSDIVRAALIQVHGYADYIKADIAKAGAVAPPYKGMVPWYDFEILSLIATHEAAAIVAPYLFDFQMRGEPPAPGSFCGTCTLDANCDGAVLSLELMNWGDAPAGEFSQMDNSAILIAWQKWAISKGYVPKDWSSKVQAPAWMLQMDAFEGTPSNLSKQPNISLGSPTVPQASTSGT
jgi:hypothetical protein